MQQFQQSVRDGHHHSAGPDRLQRPRSSGQAGAATSAPAPAPGGSGQPPAPNKSHDPHRVFLRRLAHETINALNTGYYDEPVPRSNQACRHDITTQIRFTAKNTVLYPDDSPELRRWYSGPPPQKHSQQAKLYFLSLSTLQGARYLDSLAQPSHSSIVKPLTGVLNFASATRPGGGFLNGATAQEESIARSSSLYASLSSPAANPFYAAHDHDDRGGFYTHAMIYSPSVVLIRDDDGHWLKPVKVEVVTSPAVNVKEVKKKHLDSRPRHRRSRSDGVHDGGGDRDVVIEGIIRDVMRERMARILALFEIRGVRNLVLGSFGTGVFQNDVKTVAGLWRELLYGHHARFANSFDNVLFAIVDTKTLDRFKDAFGPVRNSLL